MQRIRPTRAGQGLVEFALVAPLFLFIILGIIEGGRLLWTLHTVNNATKEGARYATVRGDGSIQPDAPATSLTIKAHMLDISSGLNPGALKVEIELLDGDMHDQSRFRIESSYQHDFIVLAIFGIDSITLNSSSVDQFWRNASD